MFLFNVGPDTELCQHHLDTYPETLLQETAILNTAALLAWYFKTQADQG